MNTKENTFTLPVIIFIYETFFFKESIKRRVLYLLPFVFGMLITPRMLTVVDIPIREAVSTIGQETRGYAEFSRVDYLFTQFSVIITYIRLIFLPINQIIDYDYPLSVSFLSARVFLSSIFLLGILGLSLYFYRLSRTSNRGLRLISFGIFWFFITLSIESTIIPLPRLILEYRAYLPSAGFLIAITIVFFLMMKWRPQARTPLYLAMCLTIIVLSSVAYARNNVWRSEIALWSDTVRKSPKNPGGNMELGLIYQSRGMIDKAIEYYNRALSVRPDNADAHFNLGTAYLEKGSKEMAIREFEAAVQINPSHFRARWYLKGLQGNL